MSKKSKPEQSALEAVSKAETVYNYTVFTDKTTGKFRLTCLLCHKTGTRINRADAILAAENHMLGSHPKVKAAVDRSWEDSLDRDAPHIKVNRKGEAHFSQGEISFQVDAHDLNNVVGCNRGECPLWHLMDSQLSQLARMNGLSVVPFARELLMPVLVGVLQMTWYRDLENHESEHLRLNQENRVREYYNKLARYRPDSVSVKSASSSSDGEPRVRTVRPRTDLSASFELVKADAPAVAKGRESALLDVMKTVKRGTISDIVVAAQNSAFKTKQNFEQQVIRFLKELVAHGAVAEVRS